MIKHHASSVNSVLGDGDDNDDEEDADIDDDDDIYDLLV